MKITPTELPGVLLIEPRVFADSRGYFYESHQAKKYAEAGILPFVQDNVSYSKKNVLRGLHYQLANAQDKLVSVLRGKVFDVAVDVRKNSPHFGQWVGYVLSDENHLQLYIPKGFAHGFCVLSDEAYFHYKCTDYYNPAAEQGIVFDDPSINIDWPITNPLVSDKDALNKKLTDIAEHDLPVYEVSL